MLVPGEYFPFQAADSKTEEMVISHCGGEPVTELDPVREFISIAGAPLVDRYPIRSYIGCIKNAALTTLHMDSTDAGIGFNRGAFLYAGMLYDVAGVRELSISNRTMREDLDAIEEDPEDFSLSAYSWGSKIPSFNRIFDAISPALFGSSEVMKKAAIIGAGTLHFAVIRSSFDAETE